MSNRVIIIMKSDLVGYPPTLSLINVLLSQNKKVIFVGQYSDDCGKKELKRKGVVFFDIILKPPFKIKNRLLRYSSILYNMKKYKKRVDEVLYEICPSSDDLIWYIFSSYASIIHSSLIKYNYVVQFYEFVDASIGFVHKLLFPSYNPKKFLQSAKSVIHCEYNRAVVMNSLYGVKGKISILPNKPVVYDDLSKGIPDDLLNMLNELKQKTEGKKVILYQGMFNSKERRLEEFCESLKYLPENFIFMAMGGGSEYFDNIRKKYNSDRYIFIPFIRPPYHLLVTPLAYIGVLAYFPVNKSIADVFNPLYCAPNKIFEYGKYAKPMISNDIPALHQVFSEFNCGCVVKYPMDSQAIAKTILYIDNNYKVMSENALVYYNSVDLESLIDEIVND